MTVQDLINQALSKLGVVGSTNTANAADSTLALATLNLVIDSFNSDTGLSSFIDRITYALPAGSAGATIGPIGNILGPRPQRIDSSFVFDSAGNRLQRLQVYSDKTDYADTVARYQQTQDYPYALLYTPADAFGSAGLNWYPTVKATGYSLELFFPSILPQFAATSDAVYVPPGYAEALIYNLALSIADSYGATPSAMTVAKAQILLDKVRSINAANYDPRMRMESYSGGAHYNLYSDSFVLGG